MRFHVILEGDRNILASTRFFEDAEAVLARYYAGKIVDEGFVTLRTKKGSMS